MPYIINNTRGEIVAVIPDGTTDTSATSLSLVGKNVTPYGEIETENLVKHLENFANDSAPSNPLEGQIWYDTDAGFIKNYTGNEWKTIRGLYVSSTAPTVDPKVGELWLDTVNLQIKVYAETDRGLEWVTNNRVPFASVVPDAGIQGDFYFNENSGQLFISDGASWSLIGPPAATGYPGTQWESLTLRDLNGDPEPVIVGKVAETYIAIVARRDFIIFADDRPTGFYELVKGITYADDATVNGTLENALTPGDYITGNVFNANSAQTWSVAASDASVANTIVARDANGDFSAGVITANLSGIANNVNGIVAVTNGGTGTDSYGNGQLLIGDNGSLSKGTITGSGSISVTNSAGAIDISYTGGTGSGTVTSVGINAGTGISVSGSPVTGSGTITVTNTGVTNITAGSGISVTQSTGNITISADSASGGVNKLVAGTGVTLSPADGTGTVTVSAVGTGGGGDMVLADEQTVTGRKTFTGYDNIVAGAYRFTYPEDNGFWYATNDPNYGNQDWIAVAFDNDIDSIKFFKEGLKIDGSSDGVPQYASVGRFVDTSAATLGGSALTGETHATTPGFGTAVRGMCGSGFTGASFQSEVLNVKGASYVHYRAYSQSDEVFEVDSGGNVTFDGAARTPSSDYAEYFEWVDGNPDNEDRVGITVVIEGNKVRAASSGDTPIGVVSAVPGVIGDSAEMQWKEKYLTDEYGRPILEEYSYYTWTDTSGPKPVNMSAHADDPDVEIPDDATVVTLDQDGNQLKRPILNPDYNPDASYIPRSKRREWAPIGLLGKLRIRKDQVINPNWIHMRDISDDVAEYFIK